MNKKQVEKLSLSVNELTSVMTEYARTFTLFGNANINCIADIYRFQEENGGYSLTRKRGLMRHKNFGRQSLVDLDRALQDLEFPSLKEAKEVLREFDAANRQTASSQGSGYKIVSGPFVGQDLTRNIIEGFLKALGKKHDPKTLKKIMNLIE